jgi:hypothetical protein
MRKPPETPYSQPEGTGHSLSHSYLMEAALDKEWEENFRKGRLQGKERHSSTHSLESESSRSGAEEGPI